MSSPEQPGSASAGANERHEVDRSAMWRQEVQASARRIENIQIKDESGKIPRLIGIAREASEERGSLRRWWNGTLVERAWLALHDAQAEALSLMSDKDAKLWWKLATGRQVRPSDGGMLPQDAAAAAISLRAYYDQSDQLFGDTRMLRNRLICLTVTGVMITGLLLAVGALGIWRIRSGSSSVVSGVGQFMVVALFGVIGAFISGLPALSRRPRRLSSNWTAPYQMALKLSVGPVFALLGVLTIESRFIDQAQPFGSFDGAVLLWAVIFGSAQQLLTGLLDRKASTLAAAHSESADTRHARQEMDSAGLHP